MGQEEVDLQQKHTGMPVLRVEQGTLKKGSVLSSRFSAPKGTVTQEDFGAGGTGVDGKQP